MDSDTPQDDGLKWFGEGFDGFPKLLPEDCVEYTIYAIDEKLNDYAATRARLQQILKVANDMCREYTKGYIWQRDAFELKIRPTVSETPSSPTQSKVPHLQGRTNFSESVADEWLVVYLLVELSKQCPDAWIRVYDTDGEFLLIEAANALPKWLNPDIAENRVWLHNGHLKIIPLDEDDTKRNLTLHDALDFLRRRKEEMVISPFIEDEAFYRLRNYPAEIEVSLHHALATIPRRLAYVLHKNPAYISPATEAFYLRDPIALRPLATKDTSTLLFPPEDFVTVGVKFTKVGYAQLRSQVFDPPPAWTSVIPKVEQERKEGTGGKVEMGLKLTCGFEMLVADKQNDSKRVVREMKMLLDEAETGEVQLLSEIAAWDDHDRQDDEKWLDIDYKDFEDELSGKDPGKREDGAGGGFGDQGAQENLRKMVSRFEDFLNDDEAGAEGVDDEDDVDEEDASGSEDSGEDRDGSFDEAEFERAMKEMMGMPADEIEKNGLLDEARKLALEDEKVGDDVDEDEEMKKVMEMMEAELKGHGALNLDTDGGEKVWKKKAAKGKAQAVDDEKKAKVVHFGPERPPNMQNSALVKNGAVDDEGDVEEIGPGDGELSSDDEDFNDVDLGLAKNMLKSFKGQAGMAGPAGNMMRALGVGMPRDEAGSDED